MVKTVYTYQYIKDIADDIGRGESFVVKDKNENIIGVLSNEKIMKYLLNPNTKIEKVYIKMKPLESNDILDISKRFLDYNTRIILLKKNNEIIPFTLQDLLKRILDEDSELLKKIKVTDVMQSPAITINYKEEIDKALNIMKNKGVSRLIVVDDNGNAIGLLSISDIIRGFLNINKEDTLYEKREKIEVRTFISNRLIFVNDNDNLYDATKLLYENNIFSLPVLNNGKPVGILTSKDLIAYYIVSKKEEIHNVVVHGINLDEVDINYIKERLDSLIRKYNDIIGESAKLLLHIKKIKEHRKFFGKNIYFSLKAKLIGSKILLHADTETVGLYEGINDIFSIFEEQLEREKSKNKKEYYINRLTKEYFEYI